MFWEEASGQVLGLFVLQTSATRRKIIRRLNFGLFQHQFLEGTINKGPSDSFDLIRMKERSEEYGKLLRLPDNSAMNISFYATRSFQDIFAATAQNDWSSSWLYLLVAQLANKKGLFHVYIT